MPLQITWSYSGAGGAKGYPIMAPRCQQWQPPSWAVVRGRAGSNGGGWRMVTGGQRALAVGGWRVVVGGRARGRWRGGAQALVGSD
jgi:hypothetical protein